MTESQLPRELPPIASPAPALPRNTRITPASASNGPTNPNATREITSITAPNNTSETPRTQFSPRERNFAGLYNPRAPHKTKITLIPNHPSDRRLKKMCPVSPSHTTSPPKKTNSSSTITRKNRSVESKAPPG